MVKYFKLEADILIDHWVKLRKCFFHKFGMSCTHSLHNYRDKYEVITFKESRYIKNNACHYFLFDPEDISIRLPVTSALVTRWPAI